MSSYIVAPMNTLLFWIDRPAKYRGLMDRMARALGIDFEVAVKDRRVDQAQIHRLKLRCALCDQPDACARLLSASPKQMPRRTTASIAKPWPNWRRRAKSLPKDCYPGDCDAGAVDRWAIEAVAPTGPRDHFVVVADRPLRSADSSSVMTGIHHIAAQAANTRDRKGNS